MSRKQLVRAGASYPMNRGSESKNAMSSSSSSLRESPMMKKPSFGRDVSNVIHNKPPKSARGKNFVMKTPVGSSLKRKRESWLRSGPGSAMSTASGLDAPGSGFGSAKIDTSLPKKKRKRKQTPPTRRKVSEPKWKTPSAIDFPTTSANSAKGDTLLKETPGSTTSLEDSLMKPKKTNSKEQNKSATRKFEKSVSPGEEVSVSNYLRRGNKALMEIRRCQKKTGLMIKRLPFARVVKEETLRYTRDEEFKWHADALIALQESTEAYLTSVFHDAYLCSLHAKRVTLMVRDIQLARRIRGD